MSNADWIIGYEAGFKVGLKKDDPEMDGTDAAHPAWWRGVDYTHLQLVNGVNKVLDGEAVNAGVASQPWEALRQRLYDIRTLLGIAERVVDFTRKDLYSSTIQRTVATWDKVRRDYEQRVQGIRAASAKEIA